MAVPLVLINAFPLDKEQWEPTLEALAAIKVPVGDIITFDPPGIGDMPATEEDPSLDLIADAAVAAMREVTGRRDALWVGCSMGGYVAMAVLQRHPDAVAGLGLIGTRASADTEQARLRRESAAAEAQAHDGVADPAATARGLLGEASAADERLLAWVTANVARQRGMGVAWGQRAMAARPDRLAVLAGASVPSFVARGEHDALTSDDEAEATAGALGVDVAHLAGAGHVPAIDAPHAVAELIGRLAAAANR